MHSVHIIRDKFTLLSPFMDERLRRLWAAAEATALGRGGIQTVATATGLSRTTIAQGIRDQQTLSSEAPPPRLRRVGGGRKPVQRTTRPCSAPWNPWSTPSPVGTPNRPCAGRARVPAAWPPSCKPWGMRSVRGRWRACCRACATACRRRAKPRKAARIPIAMRSSNTSTRAPQRFRPTANPSFR